MWSWANAPCTMLGCVAQKGQSLLKVTLLVYRNYSKCAKPKLLKNDIIFISPLLPALIITLKTVPSLQNINTVTLKGHVFSQ